MHTYHVPDMSCGHCVRAITEALTALDAQAKVETDLASKKVTVDSCANEESVVQALTDAGYPPR